MTRDEVEAALYEFVLQQFPAVRGTAWKRDDSLLASGIVDSMGILEIVTFVERRFDMTMADDDLVAGHFESIPALASLIVERVSSEAVCNC